jgi:ABC-2 type transport system permease protein
MRLFLRRVIKSAAMKATAIVGDSPLFLVNYLMRLLRVVVLLTLWRSLLPPHGATSGLTLGQVLTYTVVGEAMEELLACRTWLEDSFWNGTIATRYLRPMGIFTQFSAEMMGPVVLGIGCFSLPLLALSPLLGVDPLPASVGAGLLFLVGIAFAVTISLAMEYIFSGIAIAIRMHPFAINSMRAAVWAVLSGAFLPLALLPWGLGRIFEWLPFAATASTPLKLYIGSGDPVFMIAVQIVWALVLWPIAIWLWRLNRERMVAYGG